MLQSVRRYGARYSGGWRVVRRRRAGGERAPEPMAGGREVRARAVSPDGL